MDDPIKGRPVRYTAQQRRFETCSKRFKDEAAQDKPDLVSNAESDLTGFNSRSADLVTFCAYCAQRHRALDHCLPFYAEIGHRKRRWKTSIKTQQSEERLYERLKQLQKRGDRRPLVLAYGSWGLMAGRPGMACNKGNAPCIGVGLMRKLAKRFVVSPTPEAYTSKTCCKYFGECGPWKEVEHERGRGIRGLRRCTQRDCKVPLNRDRNGGTNIGTNFKRLFEGKGPIRTMSDEDLQSHRLNLCVRCD